MELEIELVSNKFFGSIKKEDLPVKKINRSISGVISSPSFREPVDFTIGPYGNKYEVFLDNFYEDDTFYINKCPEDLEELTYFLESLTYKGF